MSFIYFFLEKINQSELNILLVTLFVGNQPIRIQHNLKVNCLLFSKNFNHCLKIVYQKDKKKEKIPVDFLIDEIDVDSYSFHNFLDVFIVQNGVIRLSKSLFRETYSIKEFTFDLQLAYQNFKFMAELHLTRKEILFILDNLKLIRKSYGILSKTLFIPYPMPKFVQTLQQISSLLHFFKDFQSSKTCLIRFFIASFL